MRKAQTQFGLLAKTELRAEELESERGKVLEEVRVICFIESHSLLYLVDPS